MGGRISDAARRGAVTAGPKIMGASVKARMEELLEKIRSGKFAKEWLRETATGRKRYNRLLKEGKSLPIEKAGEPLRALMPWLQGPL